MRLLTAALLCGALAACAAPQRGPSNQIIARVLQGAPGEAQPSVIVAKEIAFSRVGREEGLNTSLPEFAALGGKIHLGEEVADVATYRSFPRDPADAPQFGTRSVWMSCDGGTAVTQGRFRDKDGIVGDYVMVWQRQADLDYRFEFFMAAPDDPQPPPPEAPGENEIVVTAFDAVNADVADCARRGETVPPVPVSIAVPNAKEGRGVSKDRTLTWRWIQQGNGPRRFFVDYVSNGAWKTAYDEPFIVTTETAE